MRQLRHVFALITSNILDYNSCLFRYTWNEITKYNSLDFNNINSQKLNVCTQMVEARKKNYEVPLIECYTCYGSIVPRNILRRATVGA